MLNPRVSVLMPVYNSEDYLQQSMESILTQTFYDFEFIIVEDGSSDASYAILSEYAAQDDRIVLVRNDVNMGVSHSFNRGLRLARGEYIARMDADDVSMSTRFAKQVAFMDAHPNVGICGTWLRFFGTTNKVWRLPVSDEEIRCYMFFNSPIAHPSSMLRRQIIDSHNLMYDSADDPAEDYALWAEAAKHTSFANLPEVLLHYRAHSTQSSAVRRAAQQAAADVVRLKQVARLGLDVTDETAKLHLKMIKLEEPITKEFLAKAELWIQDLQAANRRMHIFPEPAFSERLDWQWFLACRLAVHLGMSTWHSFWNSPLSHSVKLRFHTKLKFRLLCTYPWMHGVERQLRKRL